MTCYMLIMNMVLWITVSLRYKWCFNLESWQLGPDFNVYGRWLQFLFPVKNFYGYKICALWFLRSTIQCRQIFKSGCLMSIAIRMSDIIDMRYIHTYMYTYNTNQEVDRPYKSSGAVSLEHSSPLLLTQQRLTSIQVSTTAIWRPTFRERITVPTNRMNSVRNQFQPRKGVI